ncbi:hypothetical protein BKA56DRAFT_619169 [Ilyonectria sp. MPI-CAGE-AT-0026]|nr:hypothetical protein BKA56DRAFT_619169 [Ilyonectria sp. MPI-CAGE-AT-0026]
MFSHLRKSGNKPHYMEPVHCTKEAGWLVTYYKWTRAIHFISVKSPGGQVFIVLVREWCDDIRVTVSPDGKVVTINDKDLAGELPPPCDEKQIVQCPQGTSPNGHVTMRTTGGIWWMCSFSVDDENAIECALYPKEGSNTLTAVPNFTSSGTAPCADCAPCSES